ncbi:MAG: hypothetical protein QM817_13160 [Archangium sp.]
MTLTLVAALVATEVLAEPPLREMTIEGPDAGFVLFPITNPNSSAVEGVTLRFTVDTRGATSFDGVSVVGDDVFEAEGQPQSVPTSRSVGLAVHFKPKLEGSYSGRLVIDWAGAMRNDSIVLCGISSSDPTDGGLSARCQADRAPTRPFNNPNGGCSTSSGAIAVGLALLWLARWRFSASRALARSDRSPR